MIQLYLVVKRLNSIWLQRGNPVLECIKNVGKEFGDVVVDYQVGRTTGVLYLRYPLTSAKGVYQVINILPSSLRYHRLHPEYIHQRIERLGSAYNLRILLILCDIVSGFYACATRNLYIHR